MADVGESDGQSTENDSDLLARRFPQWDQDCTYYKPDDSSSFDSAFPTLGGE